MSIVRQSNGKKWVPILGAVAAALAVAVWWTQRSDSDTAAVAPAASAASASDTTSAFEALQQKQAQQQQAAQAPAEAPSQPLTAEQIREAQTALHEVSVANQQLDSKAIWKPLSGPLKDRPAFASAMEWQMLKGVAERQADPQAELLRLANFLRYTKLLEKWQDLPATADAGMRQALASQLQDDLPDRVRNGEVDAQDARRQAPALLRDAFQDSAARTKAETKLLARVQEAADIQAKQAAASASN
jgi:hypothetical protein